MRKIELEVFKYATLFLIGYFYIELLEPLEGLSKNYLIVIFTSFMISVIFIKMHLLSLVRKEE